MFNMTNGLNQVHANNRGGAGVAGERARRQEEKRQQGKKKKGNKAHSERTYVGGNGRGPRHKTRELRR